MNRIKKYIKKAVVQIPLLVMFIVIAEIGMILFWKGDTQKIAKTKGLSIYAADENCKQAVLPFGVSYLMQSKGIECYLTDSTTFRQRIGAYDEQEHFSVILNGKTIEVAKVEISYIKDTVDRKILTQDQLFHFHQTSANCIHSTPPIRNKSHTIRQHSSQRAFLQNR